MNKLFDLLCDHLLECECQILKMTYNSATYNKVLEYHVNSLKELGTLYNFIILCILNFTLDISYISTLTFKLLRGKITYW